MSSPIEHLRARGLVGIGSIAVTASTPRLTAAWVPPAS